MGDRCGAASEVTADENRVAPDPAVKTMIDALAQSYNQATVRLGMDVQPQRLAELIRTLAGIQSEGQPSLILGAVDQSPYAMAQLYQFLASDGEIQPLHAVRGVLDSRGRAIKRYDSDAPPAQKGDAVAARLVGTALQYAVTSGTGRPLRGVAARARERREDPLRRFTTVLPPLAIPEHARALGRQHPQVRRVRAAPFRSRARGGQDRGDRRCRSVLLPWRRRAHLGHDARRDHRCPSSPLHRRGVRARGGADPRSRREEPQSSAADRRLRPAAR